MAYVFNFPDVGEGIHEGRLVEWLVAQGDVVEVDQPLAKVETDKAVVELPAPEGGTVLKLHADPDETIIVGEPLVTLGEPGETVTEAEPDSPSRSPEAGGPQPVADTGSTPQHSGAVGGFHRPPATPRTRARARQLGVDLAEIVGSGSNGRITDEDVERAARGGGAPEAASVHEMAAQGSTGAVAELRPRDRVADDEAAVERVPLTHLRQVISRAMHESVQTHAHVTHVDEADVTELVAYRKALKPDLEERYGVRLTLLPFFIKALTAVLRDHPRFNASLDEERDELVLKKFYNIGVAVDTDEGLVVPVVRNADRKSLVELAREVTELAERARARTLELDELRGGTCTITNIGPLGGVFATPIINSPELAIVGLHTIKERPAVVDGEIAIRKQMFLSISFDHRMIDGAQAARFMSDLVWLVSDPKRLTARL